MIDPWTVWRSASGDLRRVLKREGEPISSSSHKFRCERESLK
jgi:hypothetical protein